MYRPVTGLKRLECLNCYTFTSTIGCVVTGLIGYANQYIPRARAEAVDHRYKFGYEINPDQLDTELSDSSVFFSHDTPGHNPQCFNSTRTGTLSSFMQRRQEERKKEAVNHLEKKWKKVDDGRGSDDAVETGKALSRADVIEMAIETISAAHGVD
ncbi:hypothetical protein L218DRAFT_942476 [Marasmius fiardii PR-910]|nr:hypothetical protein L218DRAFT_942476 [Marasmius fiardii PR-910]